ncbi:MAG: hypothetical protein RI958_2448 [Actinomycetota bacterium]|jgi:cytochrome c biogenesis protein CcmG/thiol:disulfide interchange protein DsbE
MGKNTAKPRPSGRQASSPAPKRTGLWIAVGVAAVVAIAGLVAIVGAGGDDEVTEGSVPADGSVPSGTVAETWPITVTGSPLPPLEDPAADPAVGTPAPGLSGYTFDGTPVEIDPSKGPVMLVFLAHWCEHCNREVPELLKWQASGAVPEGLQVIGVTTAVSADRPNYPPSEWIVDKGWDWPVLADSQAVDAATAMGVSGFPFSVIIGTDGTVLARSSGELGQAGIEAFVADALGS